VLKTMLAIVEAEKASTTNAACSGQNSTEPAAAITSSAPGIMAEINR
jgi:hypothetical protein